VRNAVDCPSAISARIPSVGYWHEPPPNGSLLVSAVEKLVELACTGDGPHGQRERATGPFHAYGLSTTERGIRPSSRSSSQQPQIFKAFPHFDSSFRMVEERCISLGPLPR